MSKFAIVGCEASGKTVLTASLADFFQPSVTGVSCCMVPENVAAHKFFEYTQYQMRTKHAWPQATNPDKTTVMKWSLRIDGDVVAELDTLDFGGEVFRAAFREGEPTAGGVAAQQELLEYLSSANFVVVTLSMDVLMRDMELSSGISQTDLVRDSEAKWVTRGLLDFVNKRLPAETGLVIALTQADLYYDQLKQYGGPDAIFRKSWPTVAGLYPNVPVVAVSSVSSVAEDGSPAEGYSSEGVVPLMSAFADYCVGGVDAIRESIATTIANLRDAPEDTDPKIYRRYIDEYADKVGMFRIASGLTGDYYDEELKKHVDALRDIEGDVAKKLRRLEAAAFAKYKAAEEKRKKDEAAARMAQEEKRKAEEAAERKRRAEDAKKAEDERVKAEKDLEKRQLEAKVEFEKTRAINRRSRTVALVATMSMLAVAIVSGLVYFTYTSWRAAEIASMKVRETERAARTEQLRELAQTALAGDVAAAQRIVDMLERGEIAEQDVTGLYRIYMLLVNEGDLRAMFRLGVACHEGSCGVKKSDFNAYWFLTMAKRSGYKSDRLEELLEKTASSQGDGSGRSQGIDDLFVDASPTNEVTQSANDAACATNEVMQSENDDQQDTFTNQTLTHDD